MSPIRRIFPLFAAGLALAAAASAQNGFPFQNETLKYSVSWPSGLSLGEASLSAHHSEAGWEFEMALNAGIPGYSVADKLRGSASSELCSAEFERDLTQGGRKSIEKTDFDQKKGSARRVTTYPAGGGRTEFDIPACARDALTFLYYARRELGQGRVPPPQQIYYGGPYAVRMEYAGAETITEGDKPVVADRLKTYAKGPKSDVTFDIFFARDAARTPISIRVPLKVGTFSLDLVR